MFRKSKLTLLSISLLILLSGCKFNFTQNDLYGEWIVTYTAVTIKGMSQSDVKKLRARINGKIVTFRLDNTFTETRDRNYDNEGSWQFDPRTQEMTLYYEYGNVRRLRFGIQVMGQDEMKWSFTDTEKGGTIWTLERKEI